jgi:hypothetical protein
LSIDIRDRRESGFFIIDNEIVDTYKDLSVYAVAVYAVLCRYSDNRTQQSWRTIDEIASGARVCRTTAKKGIKELRDAGLISVERTPDNQATYTLLKLEKQVLPSVVTRPTSVVLRPTSVATRLSNKEDKTLNKTNTKLNLPDKSGDDNVHFQIRDLIQDSHAKQFQQKCQWDGSEGKALTNLIKANPSWKAEDYELMVRNRFKSEAIPPDRPRMWLSNLGRYIAGPLDRFGKAPETNKLSATNRARENAFNEVFGND